MAFEGAREGNGGTPEVRQAKPKERVAAGEAIQGELRVPFLGVVFVGNQREATLFWRPASWLL